MKFFSKKEPRVWGKNEDGTPYVVGMTVAQLREVLEKYRDDVEVCVVVCPKRYWNGGGYSGKLITVEPGIESQLWLKGRVLDESLEI